jgi:hypothetical protein
MGFVARAWVEVNERFSGEVSKRFRIMSGSARAGGANPPPTDLVVIVHDTRRHVEALREEIAQVLAPMNLQLSAAKTQIVYLDDGFHFLGFRPQPKRKQERRSTTSMPSSANARSGR